MSAWSLISSLTITRLERETNIKWLIDEEEMTEDIPGRVEEFGFTIFYSDGSDFGKSTKLRTSTGSPLEPDEKRDVCGGLVFIYFMSHGWEEVVVHTGGVFGVVPIDLFVAWVDWESYLSKLENAVSYR